MQNYNRCISITELFEKLDLLSTLRDSTVSTSISSFSVDSLLIIPKSVEYTRLRKDKGNTIEEDK